MDRIKFYFIACLVTLNGLFIGYALGFNSRHVLIVDPKLPKYVKPVAAAKPKAEKEIEGTTTVTKKVDRKDATTGAVKPGAAKPGSAKTGSAKPGSAKSGTAKPSSKSQAASKAANPAKPSTPSKTAAPSKAVTSSKAATVPKE